jgi:hypothetical protein
MNQDFNAALAAFDRAIAQNTQGDAPWIALQTLVREVIGAKLFTVMTSDMQAGLARRAYSSDPVSYPASGTKPIHRDAWFDIVHGERRMFVANTIDDIAKVFPDYELIRSLGCGSVINLPVYINDDMRGTVNCLDVEHHYTPERVALTEKLLNIPSKLAFTLAGV